MWRLSMGREQAASRECDADARGSRPLRHKAVDAGHRQRSLLRPVFQGPLRFSAGKFPTSNALDGPKAGRDDGAR